MSKWKDVYNRYRELKSKWQYKYGMDSLLFSANLEKGIQKRQIFGFQVPDQQLIKELQQIRQAFDEAYYAKFPLEDVYQAALYMIRDPYGWSVQPDASKIYRGQRCHCWSIVPKLFRGKLRQEEIDSELTRLASLSETLEHEYPQYTEYQRIAIAQHYSDEACVKTWLVDLTCDPWVALFFASLDGCSGQIGNVVCFARKEWEHLSAGGKNRLGAIRLIEAQGVPRMEAQKAVFLDGAHPDLIGQYVGKQIEFRQKEGLVFEDPLMGIAKEKLLFPGKAPFLVSIAKWKGKTTPQKPAYPLRARPSNDAVRHLELCDYLELALSWVESWYEMPRSSLSQEKVNLLKKVCAFHARLQREQKSINVAARSLYRLGDALRTILHSEIEMVNLSKVVEQYLLHGNDTARCIIVRVLSEIKHNASY